MPFKLTFPIIDFSLTELEYYQKNNFRTISDLLIYSMKYWDIINQNNELFNVFVEKALRCFGMYNPMLDNLNNLSLSKNEIFQLNKKRKRGENAYDYIWFFYESWLNTFFKTQKQLLDIIVNKNTSNDEQLSINSTDLRTVFKVLNFPSDLVDNIVKDLNNDFFANQEVQNNFFSFYKELSFGGSK